MADLAKNLKIHYIVAGWDHEEHVGDDFHLKPATSFWQPCCMCGPVKMFCSSSQKVKSSCLNAGMWEALAGEKVTWRAEMARVLLAGEQHITLAAEEKRAKRKAGFQDFSNSIWGTVHLPELWSSANPRQTLFPSVKTSKVRLIFGPCPTDAYQQAE